MNENVLDRPGSTPRGSWVPRIIPSPAVTAGLLALCLWSLVATLPAWAQKPSTAGSQNAGAAAISPPAFSAPAGILVDGQSGKVLWSKDERRVRAPASLTKILSALVVLENADLSSKVTITPQARAAEGSRTYAETGWTFTVKDLLYGLLLPSGNDAAIALAQAVSPDGSEDGFMSMVNRRAAELGATDTFFTNPHGLDEPGHVTSARDMALISMTALRNPAFAAIVASEKHAVKWGDGTRRSFRNHNKLLARYPGTIGVKTGFTNQARHTLVSAVQRNGATLVAVTLGSAKQYEDSISLFDWGFRNLRTLEASSHRVIWPPAPARLDPVKGETGSSLVGDALRLLGSIGKPSGSPAASGPTGLPVGSAALSSILGGSLSLLAFGAFCIQRRLRRASALWPVPNVHLPASAEAPYTIR